MRWRVIIRFSFEYDEGSALRNRIAAALGVCGIRNTNTGSLETLAHITQDHPGDRSPRQDAMDLLHKSQLRWVRIAKFGAEAAEAGMNQEEFSQTLRELDSKRVLETRGTGDALEVRMNPSFTEWKVPRKHSAN